MYSSIICDNAKLHEELIEIINQMITVWTYMIDEEVNLYDLLQLFNISENKHEEVVYTWTSEQYSLRVGILCFNI
jgi:hypothetical protein